jgi:PAS domain S-box-containing protein
MPGGVVHVAADGAIQHANPEALRVLGLGYDDITQRYTQDFETQTIFEDGTPCAVADYPVTRAIVSGEPQPPCTIGVRRPDGDVVWAVFTAIPLEGPGGETSGAVVTFFDITARKQLELRLRQSQKMEGIGRLAGGIAHDFNNLLTVILGNAQTLEGSLPAADPRLEDVGHIRHAAQHAATLTRQLLAFASKQAVAPRVVDLRELVEHTAGMLRRIIGEHIELTIEAAPELWRVRLDPTQFEQVLVNLAVNARDAMPRGGSLRVELSNEIDADDRRQVWLAVVDSGVGIEADVLDHVFEPFFTSKPPGHGTGLGLSTCYGIVAQAGGTITASSVPGCGARFEIRLPGTIAPPEPARQFALDAPPGGGETVLVVEDEPMLREMIERTLRQLGYEVLSAGSGAEALDLARAHPGALDLLLADVVMPQMGGSELARRLQEQRPGIPVLFMSGHADAVLDFDFGPDSGVLERVLRKPFRRDELALSVRAALEASA